MARKVTITRARARASTWQEFLRWVDDHSDSTWVFRGLGDVGFALIPSIGRIPHFSLAREQQVLAAFRRRVPQFAADADFRPWDYLAIAQHHGVPTRMLDWTTNPLVAAYFAASAEPGARDVKIARKTVKATPERAEIACRVVATRVRRPRVVDTTDVENPFTLSDIGFALPRALSSRIGSQSGLFSVHPVPDAPWEEPLAQPTNVFDIPGGERDFFLKRLFYLGVDPLYLMGGLDGLGKRIAWQADRGIGLGAIT